MLGNIIKLIILCTVGGIFMATINLIIDYPKNIPYWINMGHNVAQGFWGWIIGSYVYKVYKRYAETT
jgi:hypothetical protein